MKNQLENNFHFSLGLNGMPHADQSFKKESTCSIYQL
jgi:hypothetical protein